MNWVLWLSWEGWEGHAGAHRSGALQVSGRRSPEPCSKPEKILKKATYDKVGVSGPVRVWAGEALSCAAPGCPQPTDTLLCRLTRMNWWSYTGG